MRSASRGAAASLRQRPTTSKIQTTNSASVNKYPTCADTLYRQHRDLVYLRALRLLGNRIDAEEATQEVFVRVLRTSAGYSGRGELAGWLLRITTHYCLNRIRDERRRLNIMRMHVFPSLPGSVMRDPADRLMLRQIVTRGHSLQLQAAGYVYGDGMSHEAAARELGVSRRTVGNLLERLQVWRTRR